MVQRTNRVSLFVCSHDCFFQHFKGHLGVAKANPPSKLTDRQSTSYSTKLHLTSLPLNIFKLYGAPSPSSPQLLQFSGRRGVASSTSPGTVNFVINRWQVGFMGLPWAITQL